MVFHRIFCFMPTGENPVCSSLSGRMGGCQYTSTRLRLPKRSRAPEGVRRTEIITISVLFSYEYAWFGSVLWRNWAKTNLSAILVEPMLNQKKNCVNQNLYVWQMFVFIFFVTLRQKWIGIWKY